MTTMHLKYLTYIFFLVFLTVSAYAQEPQQSVDWDSTELNAQINVYPATSEISAGETVPLVIEQVIRPHWHTYWKNPGDSGEPLKANWSLPEGFETSEISWPTPIGLPFDPLLNYGFEEHALLLQDLTAPQSLPEGEIAIPVRFDILVCKEICIPESHEKTIVFNARTSVQPTATDELISETKLSFPVPPEKNGWNTELSDEYGYLYLDIKTDKDEAYLNKHNIEFFSHDYGLIRYPDKPVIQIEGNRIILKQKRGDFKLDNIEDLGGVIVLENKETGTREGYEIAPVIVQDIPAMAEKKTEVTGNTSTLEASDGLFIPAPSGDTSLLSALLFAVLGGLILNLMPCVFPVLSMKALSLSKISQKSRTEAQKHGLAYTAGIILSFLVIAGLLIVLKAGGSEIGWGFHLQNPIVILLLAYLFFVIGLNLSGFFEIGNSLMGIGQSKKTEGVSGSFTTGILATLVATPCTAPFMAAALGYALVKPTPIALLIFAALGLGLALPYLMISFIPALQKVMPKPGQWMVTFKELLAFPMYGTVIWLLWVLSNQIGMNGVAVPLMGLLAIAFSIWLYKHSSAAQSGKKTILIILAFLTLGAGLFYTIYETQTYEMSKDKPMPEFGAAYSPDALSEALSSDRPVFVEMTAAWCVTCKVNHYRAIDIPETKEIISRQNVVYMIGDWTNYDAEITQYLNKFGRNGVPIYIYYGRPDPKTGERPEPQMLPQILSPSVVANALDK